MHKRNPIRWKRRSAMEHGLTVVAVSRVFLCIALAIGKAEALGARSPAEDVQTVSRQACYEDLCLSPGCIHTASMVINNMDPDVEPCDDFYQFACGGFLKSTFVPKDEDHVDAITDVNDKMQKQLRAIVEEPSEPNEWKPFTLVKNLYKSCMNETAIEDQSLEPLHKIIKIVGGWPVLDGKMWNEADFDWISTTYKFRDAGYFLNCLFTIQINDNSENKERHMITLDTPNLETDYVLGSVNNKYLKAYYSYMVDIAVRLGADRKRASTELKESLLFEIDLSRISRTRANLMNSAQSSLMTLNELTNNYPSIPWREYFGKLLPNIRVEENEVVLVKVPVFISDLEKLLFKTPKRIQANYIIWKAVKDSVSYLNDDIRKRQLAYWTARGIRTRRRSRMQECVDLISERLYVAVANIYVRKYFNAEVKQNIVDIGVDIRQQFYKIIQQVEWMDAKTRQSTLEKATAISIHVAYSDKFLNETKVNKLYENLELSGGNYFDSILNLTLADAGNSFRTSYINPFSPSIIKDRNILYIPATILQGAYFGSYRPKYINYGSIGLIIGYSIAHIFDDILHQFDKDGKPVAWPERDYAKRIECIIDQYGNYTVEEVGLKLNGTQSRNSNIAANAGIKVAYLAYKDWVKRNKPEQKLPGLLYSPNQMFWIGAANMLCAKWEPEALKRYITDGRSPDKFRLLGSVSNMPEFSKDFNCPIGSKMNPEKKCSVW